MTLIEANPPSEPLYHIGRNPDPFAWMEWRFVGASRFDDPRQPGKFRVLYAAEQRLAAFVETLQKWRPSIEAIAALNKVTPAFGGDVTEAAIGIIPADWHLKRSIGTLLLPGNQRWLDLREHETRETLRVRLAPALERLGVDDFDQSELLAATVISPRRSPGSRSRVAFRASRIRAASTTTSLAGRYSRERDLAQSDVSP